MILKKPKAIIFDLDDTFYSYKEAHAIALKKVQLKLNNEFGVNEKIFTKYYDLENKNLKKILKNTASSHNKFLYFKKILERLKFTPYIRIAIELNNLYWEVFYNEMTPFPYLKEFLIDVKHCDIIIGVVTNYDASYQFKKILNLGIEDEIDYLISSEEVGINKPNKEPFLKTMELLNLKKEESWMVGDSLKHDIEPAKKIMKSTTFLYTSGKKNIKNHDVDYCFSSYSFMRKVLSNLG